MGYSDFDFNGFISGATLNGGLFWKTICILSNLAKSILLLVWILVFGVLHFGSELWTIVNCHDIFPTMW